MEIRYPIHVLSQKPEGNHDSILFLNETANFFTLMDAASVNLLNTYVLQLHKPRKRSVKATVYMYVAQSKMISHQPEWGIPAVL